jgi:hypothetical protein
MLSTIFLYVLSFICVGWGSGLLSLIFTPIVLMTGRDTIGGKLDVSFNAFAMFLATIAVGWIAGMFDRGPSITLFILPLVAMILNNRSRIRNSQIALAQSQISMEPSDVASRERVVSMEVGHLWSDLLGFAIGIIFLSPMPIIT